MRDVMTFRNMLAENNIELTPDEAANVINSYEELLLAIKTAYELNPNFAECLLSKTTEQKLEDIKMFEEERGEKLTLEDYNKLQKTMLAIFTLEGYVQV